MLFNTDDTICAVASAPDGAARGIVRVSGSAAVPIAAQLFAARDRLTSIEIQRARTVHGRASIRIGEVHHDLPCHLMIWPGSRSYTREPVVEWHTVGCPSLLDALATALCEAG